MSSFEFFWRHSRELDDTFCFWSLESRDLHRPFHLALICDAGLSTIFILAFCFGGFILEEMTLTDFSGAKFTSPRNFYTLLASGVGFCFHTEEVKG